MEKYQNLSGKSGVSAFEIGTDYILIQFVNSNDIYRYNYIKPGKGKVEKMKMLATRGMGLSTFISQQVANDFDKY